MDKSKKDLEILSGVLELLYSYYIGNHDINTTYERFTSTLPSPEDNIQVYELTQKIIESTPVIQKIAYQLITPQDWNTLSEIDKTLLRLTIYRAKIQDNDNNGLLIALANKYSTTKGTNKVKNLLNMLKPRRKIKSTIKLKKYGQTRKH